MTKMELLHIWNNVLIDSGSKNNFINEKHNKLTVQNSNKVYCKFFYVFHDDVNMIAIHTWDGLSYD